jgi:nucleotide-binding universal stress UspA family protein
MTKHSVLIPLDGSEFSRQIIPSVCRLLDQRRHRLILLRVADPPAGMVAAPPRPLMASWPIDEYASAHDAVAAQHPIYASQTEQNVRAELEAALAADQHALVAAGYTVTTQVRFGDAAPEIVAAAAELRVELVAMSTHGRTGVGKLVLGSVAGHVLHNLATPLLLVRPHVGGPRPTVAAPRTIVVPLDGSAFAEQALGPAQSLAADGARLLLVAAAPPIDDTALVAAGVVPGWLPADTLFRHKQLDAYLKRVARRLAEEGFVVHTRLLAARPNAAILSACDDGHADLIVMATHSRRGVSRLFLGSVAAQVVHGAELPVLLVRPQVKSQGGVAEGEAEAQTSHAAIR